MSVVAQESFVKVEEPSAALLDRGALVYLWAPGEAMTSRPSLVRVERATAHAIIGRDLGNQVNAQYDVSDATPVDNRWTWELAASPEHPLAGRDVEHVDVLAIDRAAAYRLMLGEPGTTLTFHLGDGTSVSGVVTAVVWEREEATWLVVSSLPNAQKSWRIRLQWNKITQIKEMDVA